MSLSLRGPLFGRALVSLVLHAGALAAPALAQGPATVVIVIDDTQVRAGDGPHVAELLDRLERDVLDARVTFGIVTVGPGGLNVDLTKERRRLREVSAAARAGRLDFTLPQNPEMAMGALMASLGGAVDGLKKRPGAKAFVVVGRSHAVTEKRQDQWSALRRDAGEAEIRWAWFELGHRSCQSSTVATDAAAAKDGMCASLSDTTGRGKVLEALADLMRR
jgi:hypothetical protein